MCRDLDAKSNTAIVKHFNSIFLDEGLIHRERWLPRNGMIERLREKYELAFFTGRTSGS